MTDQPAAETDMQALSDAVRQKQIAAADPGASVWVRANAGSGKTRVLVDRLLRLLLGGVPPDQILALTFTKAAAAEMTDRLQRNMNLWAGCDDDELVMELTELTGQTPTMAETRRARALFAVALETPGGLKIQTIHGFCQSVLERFSVEAGVPANFTIIEEQDAALLKAEATESLLAHVFTDDDPADRQLAAALHIVINTAGEFGFAKVINDALAKAGMFDRLFSGPDGVGRAIDNLSTLLGLSGNDDCFAVPELLAIAPQLDLERLRSIIGKMATEGSKNDLERAAEWIPFLEDQTPANFDLFVSGFLTSTGEPRKERSLMTKKTDDKARTGLAFLLETQAAVIDAADRQKAYVTRSRTAALLAVIDAILKKYAAAKAARGALDYGDLILKTRALLEADGGAGWVLYKLDRGLDHILVDEAQDTSPDQWAIINALATEFFAGLGAREPAEAQPPRTIFAVGDEKQSIYRFQGADPGGFARMAAQFGTNLQALDQIWRDIELEVSFRSTPAVLRFVDQVFAADNAHKGLSASGKGTTHIAFRQSSPGLIVRWPLIDPPAEMDHLPWQSPVDAPNPASPLNQLAKRIADEITNWFQTNRKIKARNRPVRPGDILILLNTRGVKMETIARALKNNGIPVAGTDRMVLSEQMAVMDLMVLGDWALFPADDLALATLLKSPFCNLDEEALFTLAHDRPGSLWQQLETMAAANPGSIYARSYEWLAPLPAKASRLRPFDFYSQILDRNAGRKKLLWRLGQQAVDPINEFLARALSFEASRTASVQNFLHNMRRDTTQLKRDMDKTDDAVRIMTVHGAKGLEAPVVIMPDLMTAPKKGMVPALLPAPDTKDGSDGAAQSIDALLWQKGEAANDPLTQKAVDLYMEDERAEYRRLLYVALTRAEDELYLAGFRSKRDSHDEKWADYIAAPAPERQEKFRLLDDDDALRDVDIFEDDLPVGSAQTDTPATAALTSAPLPIWAEAAARPEQPGTRPLAPSALFPSSSAASLSGPAAHDSPANDHYPADVPSNSPLVTGIEDANAPSPLKRGTLLHLLLETLPDLPADIRRETAIRLLSRPAHNIPADLVTDWTDEIMAIMDHPDFAPLFGAGSMAEVPLTGLVGKNADLALSGQIDRLAVTDDKVMIIDYKTNQPPPAHAADVPLAYIAQMAAYRALLRKLYPDHKIVAALLFTDSCQLIIIGDDQMDKVANKITGLA